jgi:endonuclease/exonuclease/phosphatase family metal-dependent hydrolase
MQCNDRGAALASVVVPCALELKYSCVHLSVIPKTEKQLQLKGFGVFLLPAAPVSLC